MSTGDASPRKAQLDKAEREQLEDVVVELRELVEREVEYELEHRYDLTEKDGGVELAGEEAETRERLVEAIEHEDTGDRSWEWCYRQYISGVGYTIVNRLAAFRCMEVRGFLDRPVTQIGESGLTPAAERVLSERYSVGKDEALVVAYHEECEKMEAEIEILFNLDSPYSVIDPDSNLFRKLVGILDDIPDEVWRADDVLGWMYEYYNRPLVEALDAKNTLEPEDVGPANQFYTPHWVVRMLTDNSLGKLYLESTDRTSTIPEPEALSPDERKERLVTPEDSPGVPELCTYLIPDDDDHDAPSFAHPSALRVIDPACGSGHFLLYAFDVLERIWWAETDLDRSEIPAKILENNLFGVDIDLRSCQLTAFNLYLKARMRTEEEGGDFEMPNVGIVCADATVAEVDDAVDVLDDITGEETDLREALDDIIEEFQSIEALGSLLDVRSELEDEFMDEQTDVMEWSGDRPHTLNGFLRELREAVAERTGDSFGEQNLRSFLNLLVVLTQDYDVALMNPPYGSQGRIPPDVRNYLEENYRYTAEFYINFFETCDRITKENGRVGMIVPRTFMFKKSLEKFREDFIGELGSFDFLAEYGNDVLDNATVRTAGTVVRTDVSASKVSSASFFRLHDVTKQYKEDTFLDTAFGERVGSIDRLYTRNLDEFSLIPGTPLSYWMPKQIRTLFESSRVFDASNAHVEADSAGSVKAGLTTGDNGRFIRRFWETTANAYVPYAKGGKDAWLLPRVDRTIYWGDDGIEVKRHPGSYPRNEEYYFKEVLTYTYLKEGGRRFGYLNPGSLFDHAGKIFAPEIDTWSILGYANTDLVTYLMLGQTPDRHWEVSHVSKLPYDQGLEELGCLNKLTKDAVGYLISKRQYEINSPYYVSPILLAVFGIREPLSIHEHPHRELREQVNVHLPSASVSTNESLEKVGIAVAKHLETIESNLHDCADEINTTVFDYFEIPEARQKNVLQEINLRTNENPQDRESHNPEEITELPSDFPEMVKDLLLHFAVRVLHEDDDGIIPISDVEEEDNLLTRIESEFERIFGEHASARLAEVDQVLGSQSADKEAYPNLREWLEEDLFDYHVSKFDRTPILWRLTTERLVSDSEGEGFACLVDYHQLDAGLFDRLQSQYLEPRKELLRERRNAADRQRNDDSLSASEQTAAKEEFARHESGLRQISLFEERLSELAQPTPREWSEENQQTAEDALEDVSAFRKETASRLETLEELATLDDVDMEDLFTPSFYDKVQDNKEEWLDALDDLETALEAYAADGSEPIEAHLYDLFEYYDDLIGTPHFASNGILFMTYYFGDFEPVDQNRLGELSEQGRLCAELAQDLDDYKETAETIATACDELSSEIPSWWRKRAIDEITVDGYRPNRKHGVAINITPLAEQDIVPKIVEDKVI